MLGPSVVWPRMFSVTTLLHVQSTDFPPDMTDCCRSCWFNDPVNGLARRSSARNRKQAAAHKAATKEATYAVVDKAAVDKQAADRARADKVAVKTRQLWTKVAPKQGSCRHLCWRQGLCRQGRLRQNAAAHGQRLCKQVHEVSTMAVPLQLL